MSLAEWANIATIVASIAVVGVAIQVVIAYIQLKADHERGRREKTVEILMEWDKRLKKEGALARKIIERISEDQCRDVFSQQEVLISKKLENLVQQMFDNVETKGEEGIQLSVSQSSELRWHILTYLNSLESVMVAWQYSIVDRVIIENQFAYLFSPADGHEVLKEFRAVAGGEDAYPAIEVFVSHLKEKRRNKLIQKANVA